jgi:ribose transport system ATP-binding protein
MPAPAAAVSGVSKTYPGVQALRDVSFDILPGEVHVLVGENGAGKSTLVKILSGAVQPDTGSISASGNVLRLPTPHAARAAGISTVHQELSLVPDLSVTQNIFLGREPGLGGSVLLRRAAMEREARRLLRDMGLDLDPNVPVRRLSLAVRQVVEIVRALSVRSRVLILDEPTSSLSEQECEELFGRIRQVTAEGVGVLYISHRLEELSRVGNRVTVLRDGRVVAPGLPATTPLSELIHLMVGRSLDEEFPSRNVERGGPVLQVRNLSVPGRVHDVSLEVHAGEVLGIFGLVGAGRTELLRAIYGLDRTSGGQIERDGRAVRIRSPREAIAARVALVPEDRHGQGLVLPMSVGDNICLSVLSECTRGGLLSRLLTGRLAHRFMDRLRIKAPGPRTGVLGLSGGNQQKVVIARALAAGPEVLLLDEPTRGVDVGAKTEIYELVGELIAEGKGVVVVSSEMLEVLGLADRILVMRKGRISAELSRAEATQERLLEAALPAVEEDVT